jgi:hypothetical protein
MLHYDTTGGELLSDYVTWEAGMSNPPPATLADVFKPGAHRGALAAVGLEDGCGRAACAGACIHPPPHTHTQKARVGNLFSMHDSQHKAHVRFCACLLVALYL